MNELKLSMLKLSRKGNEQVGRAQGKFVSDASSCWANMV
jgi:hypothetical protein